MIDDLGKLLDRVSSPVDLAVILLTGPLVFLLEAGLDLIPFLPPGYVAIIAASFALGVRKVAEARLTPLREERDRAKRRQELRARAEALRERVGPTALGARLRDEVELFDAGITTEEQFGKAVTDCVEDYRYVARLAFDAGVHGPPR